LSRTIAECTLVQYPCCERLDVQSGDQETYSVTRLVAFRQCPKRYHFKYVERTQEAFQSVEAFVGEIVHRSIAWLYDQKTQRMANDKASLIEFYNRAWMDRPASVRVVRPKESFQQHRTRGVGMLTSFFDRVFWTDSTRTLHVEHEFKLHLARRPYLFTGKVDRLSVEHNGALRVVDYKTSRRGSQSLDLDEDMSLQLDAYGLWALLEKHASHVNLSIEFLADGNCSTIPLKRREANAVVQELVGRIEEVRGARSFPARPSPLCGWCPYRGECPERWRGPFSRITPSAAGTRCPWCGGRLTVRTGRWGRFLGCDKYPRCHYTRDA